ncbi:MAG: hypothetical protein L3K15_01800 [Thermoplasmata archaeon]|nr:hypothetical protein [Thermoplasmata archaeon]
MRALLGATLFIALLVALPAWPTFGATAGAAVPPLPANHALGGATIKRPALLPALAPAEFSRPMDSAMRLANHTAPSSGGPPNSAIFASPAPILPPTTPVVETVAANTTGCCSYLDFAAPAGPFALIELNYTGTVYGSVYDSSYRAYVDGVPILFGTTPEYGRWVVLKDLTEYSALFQGTVNVTFLLSAAIISGSFTSTVTVSLFPVPTGQSPPSVANVVLPIWTSAYVKPGVATLSANVTVPSNATNATLELYAYGFSADEFWYASEPTESAFRLVEVSSDGTPIATVLPFPYLNTGGLDLFLWRPIPATFTLNDRPYRVDLTAALGLLEGTHSITITVQGRDPSSPWLVMGGLFVTTSKTGAPALATSDVLPTIADHTTTPASNVYDNAGSIGYAYSSTFTGAGGTTNVSTQVLERFVNNETVPTMSSSWDNLTGSSTMQFWTNLTTPSSVRSTSRSYSFSFGVDLGGSFVETSNTGGGYPIYGNFTSDTLNVVQGWNETGLAANGVSYALDERLGASGVYAGREERISANAAQILSINFIQSQTTEELLYRSTNGTLTAFVDHLLVGSSYQPPGPFSVETVTVDRWDAPLAAAVVSSVVAIDLGESVTFTAVAVGGRGAVTATWTPTVASACTATSSGWALRCRPTATGSFGVSILVSDAAGDPPGAGHATVLVLPDPAATFASSPSAADLGMSFRLTPTIAGGVGPYSCAWSIAGGPRGPSGSCSLAQNISANATGPLAVLLTVTDATGGTWNFGDNLTVNPLPTLVVTSGGDTTVGSGTELAANVSGGTAPFVVNWYEASGGASAKLVGTGGVIVFTPTAPGVFAFTATVVDGVGRAATSSAVNVTVATSSTGANAASGSAVPLWGLVGLIAALAVEAIAVVALLVLRQQDRRRRRPPAPRSPRPAPGVERPPDGEE